MGDAADDAIRRAEREVEESEKGVVPGPWDSLEEWQRESWRREYRDA